MIYDRAIDVAKSYTTHFLSIQANPQLNFEETGWSNLWSKLAHLFKRQEQPLINYQVTLLSVWAKFHSSSTQYAWRDHNDSGLVEGLILEGICTFNSSPNL